MKYILRKYNKKRGTLIYTFFINMLIKINNYFLCVLCNVTTNNCGKIYKHLQHDLFTIFYYC